MPLTPEDVSNKRFTPVRLREGYDMGEVDQFLDEVEAELARLTRENADLKSKIQAAQSGAAATPAPVAEVPKVEEPAPLPATGATASTGDGQVIRVETTTEASNAAARLLEMATRQYDDMVDQAKTEADRIVTEAQAKADKLTQESEAKAQKTEEDARNRAEMLDQETAERRTQLMGDLEKERDKLTGDVDGLRAFEREYRSRLKSYFNEQLAALEQGGSSSSDNKG